MTFCESMARSMLASVEGTITPEAREQLTQHLRGCDACRATLHGQLAVKQWLGDLPWPDVSPDFATRVRARLVEDLGWLGVANWQRWTLRLAPLAALLLALVWLPLQAESGSGSTTALLETWWTGGGAAADTPASLLLNPDVDAQALLAAALAEAAR